MKNSMLMPLNEPTDKQLVSLMKEVVADAKSKANKTKKLLAEQIAVEVSKAEVRFKAKG